MKLTEQVALVTGGGRGIGRAIAKMLAEEGAAVALAARSRDEIEAVRREIEAAGGRALAVQADVSDEQQVLKMMDEVGGALGPVDILVNCAGVPTKRPTELADYETADWDRIMNVNLRGVFLCSREAVRGMRARRRGTIINIASIAGIKAAPNVAPYSTAKYGVMALNQTLLAENARYGIKVHAVCPGTTDTPIWDKKEVPLSAEVRSRMLRPENVAEVVRFLVALPQNVRVDEIVVLPNEFPVALWDYQLLS